MSSPFRCKFCCRDMEKGKCFYMSGGSVTDDWFVADGYGEDIMCNDCYKFAVDSINKFRRLKRR